MNRKKLMYSNYGRKLKRKVNSITKKEYLSNDDLHELFHLYDKLDHIYCYDNEDKIKEDLEAYRGCLSIMNELYGDLYDF